MSTPTTQITISRNMASDVGRRQIIVSIDDGPRTTLLFGQSITRSIPPGAHVLRLNNTLVWKNIKFEAQPGEHVQFAIANRAGRLTLGFLSLMGVGPLYLTVERV